MNKKLMIMALMLSGIAAGNTAMACGISSGMDAEHTSAPETAEMADKAAVVEE